jgi:hypothetical protein
MFDDPAVLRLTLDTNCLIALDENREPDATCLRLLLVKHAAGRVHLQLVATSASERQLTGPYLDNFSKFRERLETLGLGHLPLLLPIAVADVSYLDWCILADEDDVRLLDDIYRTLFPGQPLSLQDALSQASKEADLRAVEHKWRNRELDVHALWCHLHYGGDAFVTSDKNFHKKQGQLARFGSPLILTPCQAGTRIA